MLNGVKDAWPCLEWGHMTKDSSPLDIHQTTLFFSLPKVDRRLAD